jgi:hypothetical protein
MRARTITCALIAAVASACAATADETADRSNADGAGGSTGPGGAAGGVAGGGTGGAAGGGTGGAAGAGTGGAAGSTSGTGGTSRTDGGDVADAKAREAEAPRVGTCDGLGAVGQWQSITPPEVPLPGAPPCDFGTMVLVVDPVNLGTVYVTTCQHGLHKTSDCGATWAKTNTGKNGAVIDDSRQWTLVIDPEDPKVLYTNAGYYALDGNNMGALKSTDGGVSWEWMWPPGGPGPAPITDYNFVSQINMDPTNPKHLLMGFHGCKPPYGIACFGETKDGGETWTIQNGDSRWEDSESQTPYPVNDHIFLFANHDTSSAMWVTTDSGASWNMIAPNSSGHWPGQLYHAPSGYYMGYNDGILHSVDGAKWAPIPNYTGGMVTGFAGDGTTMWAANWGSYTPWTPGGINPYMSSKETDGLTWTLVPWTTPAGFKFTQGGLLGYDPGHHVLFSANGTQGVWRVVTQ